MIFSLDVLRARKGDCLLLHFGTKKKPGLVLIDGGPSGVYGAHLEPRLTQIRKARKLDTDTPLPIDLLMVSHVDDDHIRGVLDLTKAEIQEMDAQRPRSVDVLDLWHNSFDAIIGGEAKELTAAVTAHVGPASTGGSGPTDEDAASIQLESSEHPEVVRSGLAVLATIEQGFRLRQDAEKLGYPMNAMFDGELILAKRHAEPVDLGRGLELTVAGPMKPEVTALRKKHKQWLQQPKKAKSTPAALAAYIDTSVPNLSSLVVLVEAEGKRVLLTGDARGDKILEGLELAGLLEQGGTMKVDVLKVPHHGSANNLEDDFFERVVARHYIFSGNGQHGNPEREAFEMLLRARGKAAFVAHLTYPIDEIDGEREKDWEREREREQAKKKKKPGTVVRAKWSAKKHGLAALLEGGEMSQGQKVRIVGTKKPHVIDLLVPFKG
jgi:hypothetical protein